ncbi:MAG: hypothetical protein WDZ76_03895 [Pseudohongiellaceae bacterium]
MHYRNRLSVIAFLFLIALAPVAVAQNLGADDGRYRPLGREIAAEIGRDLGERLYEVRTYDPEPEVGEFSAATLFYPLTLSFDPPIPSVVLVPGYRGTQAAYDWWGPALASLGIAVMILDTNTPEDSLEDRSNALVAAVDFLQAENGKDGSPLQNRLSMDKIGIMGHSLGGGASLAAARELGDSIGAVVALTPYCCELRQSFTGDYSDLMVPSLIITTAEDTVAPPDTHGRLLYESMADSVDKAYVEFATGAHNLPTNAGTDLQTLALYTVVWLKQHLDDNAALAEWFTGEPEGDLAEKFSRFESSF